MNRLIKELDTYKGLYLFVHKLMEINISFSLQIKKNKQIEMNICPHSWLKCN